MNSKTNHWAEPQNMNSKTIHLCRNTEYEFKDKSFVQNHRIWIQRQIICAEPQNMNSKTNSFVQNHRIWIQRQIDNCAEPENMNPKTNHLKNKNVMDLQTSIRRNIDDDGDDVLRTLCLVTWWITWPRSWRPATPGSSTRPRSSRKRG